jgi:outer membrane protein TolC
MRPRRRFWAASTVLVTLAASRISRADDLTLADAVRLALANNERSRIAELSRESAEAAVARARAAFLPVLSLGANETLRPGAVEDSGRVVARSNAASAALTLNQPLLVTTAFPLYAAAKHSEQSARYDEANQRRQLCFDAARAFFGLIAQQRILAAAQHRLERADATLNDTRARAEAQLVSTNDVTRARVDRASAAQSVANAQGALEQARLNLAYVINAEVEGSAQLPDQELANFRLDGSSLATIALGTRPDLASSREAANAAADSADEPALRFVPTLTASGQARTADQPVVGERYIDTTLTLNLSWSIWDAGIRSADSQSRHAAAASASLEVQALRRRIGADVASAIAEVVSARASLDAAKEGLDAATRNAEETTVLYKQGLAKAIELVDSNLSRFDAEISLAAAQLAVRQAELDLRSAMGLFPVDGVQ